MTEEKSCLEIRDNEITIIVIKHTNCSMSEAIEKAIEKLREE